MSDPTHEQTQIRLWGKKKQVPRKQIPGEGARWPISPPSETGELPPEASELPPSPTDSLVTRQQDRTGPSGLNLGVPAKEAVLCETEGL